MFKQSFLFFFKAYVYLFVFFNLEILYNILTSLKYAFFLTTLTIRFFWFLNTLSWNFFYFFFYTDSFSYNQKINDFFYSKLKFNQISYHLFCNSINTVNILPNSSMLNGRYII